MTRTLDALTTLETEQLQSLEGRIQHGWTAFLDVGEALLTVRDARLYRASHASFEAYCEERWGWSKSHANRLISAFEVQQQLAPHGVTLRSEATARPLTTLPPEDVSLVARAIKEVTGSSTPSTAEVKAFTDTVRDLHNTGLVEDPDTGEQKLWTELPEGKRMSILRENVTNNTYERLQRQKTHIEESKAAALRPNVLDWLDDYRSNNLASLQFIEIVINRDGYTAKLTDEVTGAVLAEATGSYFKQCILRLIEQLGAR